MLLVLLPVRLLARATTIGNALALATIAEIATKAFFFAATPARFLAHLQVARVILDLRMLEGVHAQGTGQTVLDSFQILICALLQIGHCRRNIQKVGEHDGKVSVDDIDPFLNFVRYQLTEYWNTKLVTFRLYVEVISDVVVIELHLSVSRA